MKPEIKKLWVEALRSGERRQGKDSLRADDSFCCLGVLCDLNDPNGWRPLYPVDPWDEEKMMKFGGDAYDLPVGIMEWAGLDDSDPMVQGRSLSDRNDSGASFEEIAALIEANL